MAVSQQFWRGTLGEAKEVFSTHQPKGEITLLIEGKANCIDETPSECHLEKELSDLISSGHSLSMVMISLIDVYQIICVHTKLYVLEVLYKFSSHLLNS